MKIGTKTLLFGAHQFVLHPIYTYVAWKKLYHKFPSLGETVAIIIHDWGYFGKPNLDEEEGEKHPEWANKFFIKIGEFIYENSNHKLGNYLCDLGKLCLLHSRFYANRLDRSPSKLCWADKYGTTLYGKYLWGTLVTMSGEHEEYMTNDKYEIYYKGAKDNGKLKWFTEYVSFITPIIHKNVDLINNHAKKHLDFPLYPRCYGEGAMDYLYEQIEYEEDLNKGHFDKK